VCSARTDAEGKFSIGAVSAKRALLTLRAYGHAGRDVVWQQTADPAIVLPVWRGGEVEFVIAAPAGDAAWIGECDLAGGIRALLRPGEEWRVALPHAGRFDFAVQLSVGGGAPARCQYDGLHATGSLTLSLPRRQ
jgi:hypothetical protein